MVTSRQLLSSLLPTVLLSCAAFAKPRESVPITVTVATTSKSVAIPPDFVGLGFETAMELPNAYGVRGHFFTQTNKQVIALLQNIGVRNIRLGGGTVNGILGGVHCAMAIPTDADIANLFQFARAADVEVIYSLRQLNMHACPTSSLASNDASAALYIWKNYRGNIQSFAIGNEPDWRSLHTHPGHVVDPGIYETISGPSGSAVRGSAYPSYLADWRKVTDTILRLVPAAVFSGPDTGAYSKLTYTPNSATGVSWTQKFAEDEKSAKNGIGLQLLKNALQHYYVGGSPKGTTSQQAIDNMLSRNWVNDTKISKGPEGPETYTPYPWLFTHNLEPILKDGVPYRMTEANDVLGGVQGASNGYAAALWALDYMHWWAAHGMAGVNFHNNPWIKTDTIVPNPNPCIGPCGNYQSTPKGYGMKAFDLGGHGYVEPVAISNPRNINVTAYAVGDAQDLYVTIINKTHSSTHDIADAVVTIRTPGFNAASAASMVLTDGDPGNAASLKVTLGGALIPNKGRWVGQWMPLGPDTNGRVIVTVPSTTAAVIRIHAVGNYAGPIQLNQNGTLEVFGTRCDEDVQPHKHNNGNVLTGCNPDGHTWRKRQLTVDSPDSPLITWDSWKELGGRIRSSGDTIVAKTLDETLEVITSSATGDVYSNYQLAQGGSWNGWTDMGSSSSGITSLQAANNTDGSLSIFGIRNQGDVWVTSQNAPGVAWSNWTDLRGERIQPGFVVGQNLNGRLEVVGADSSGGVWDNRQTDSGAWGDWKSLSGKPVNPRLAIARNVDGRLEAFGVDSDGNVWHNWQFTPGGDWKGWSEIAGKRIEPGFVVGQTRDGRLAIFGVETHGHSHPRSMGAGDHNKGRRGVWSSWQQTPGGTFRTEWMNLGGSNIDPELLVGNTADGRIELFSVGSNREVWTDWQLSNVRHWSGWSDLGGKGVGFYSDQK